MTVKYFKLKVAGLSVFFVVMVTWGLGASIKNHNQHMANLYAAEDQPFVNQAGQHVVTITNYRLAAWLKRHPEAVVVALTSHHGGTAIVVYTIYEVE
ncbi:hypothetical protein LCGC14_0164060 [marine sediment metagenome]|uniref:Uncharacterized protein n=1 Tax=marine sediment metagenome TaxID=412755 RepID=A0A0F9VAJ0_9ZZZZ